MADLLNQLLDWVSTHTLWAGIAVFLVAFSESVAIIGLLVPGVMMMFGFGALIATGALAFWPVFWFAVGGAVAGDGLSFWLGRHYQGQLREIWPFRSHPRSLLLGIDFFQKYGGKSVAIGRFFGPVRAVIPLVAGMLGMGPWRFLAANLLSALVWAPAYLLPGIVFGASLELAAEVAFRLVAILLLAAGLIWFSFALARLLFRLLQPHATRLIRGIMQWGSRYPRLSDVVNALGDPEHPEARGLGMLATFLLLGTLLFGLLAAAVLEGTVFTQPDHLLFNALQSIRNPWSDDLLIQITHLADSTTILLVGLAVGLFLLRERHHRALYHWLAAIAFGLFSPILLKYALQIPRPYVVEGLGPWAFPSAHVLRATVTYGFLAILIARALPLKQRWLPYSLTTVLVAAVAFSRLYLGVHWLSDVLGSLLLGLAWISGLGLAYYRHTEGETHWAKLGASALLALLISISAINLLSEGAEAERYHPQQQVQLLSRNDWQAGKTTWLPEYREDTQERSNHPLHLQYAGDPARLAEQLKSQGWRPTQMLGWHNLLHLLSPSLPLQALPVLPQVHDGKHEGFSLVKDLTPDSRLVLRLWSTPVYLEPEGDQLWIGNVAKQSKTTLLGLLTFAETEGDFTAPFQLFKQSLAPLGLAAYTYPHALLIQPIPLK